MRVNVEKLNALLNGFEGDIDLEIGDDRDKPVTITGFTPDRKPAYALLMPIHHKTEDYPWTPKVDSEFFRQWVGKK